ncbi:hypothetical protein SAMN05421852_10722 [Thermoflavimicrobium dichotomicum]|uniref:Uncharacterized protein n=1 Tax=Thermoflavimicrobium dichotomicum TaxID=46223 RepID=A0A1I3Q6X8_9BACL|nr:hypothetical protein SAMN05421852_10722 [Thermoflavimicrobium dichotomicum]
MRLVFKSVKEEKGIKLDEKRIIFRMQTKNDPATLFIDNTVKSADRQAHL